MEASGPVGILLVDMGRDIVFHVNDLHTGHSIERSKPQKLLLLRSCKEEVLAVLSLQGEGKLPVAGDRVLLLSMVDDRIDVEQLRERNFVDLL